MSDLFEEDFLQILTAIHFPKKAGFLVITFNGEASSTDQFGQVPLFTWPNSPVIVQGGRLTGKSLHDTIFISNKKKTVARSFSPFRIDKTSTLDSSLWDYQQSIVCAGLKGGPFSVRNTGLGVGAHSDDVFQDGKDIILQGWMTEFGWGYSEAESHIGFMMFQYDFDVLQGLAPPNVDPSTDIRANAITTKINIVEHGLEVFKRDCIVVNLSNVNTDPKAKTFKLVIDNQGIAVGHINLVACWTYKPDDIKKLGFSIDELESGTWNMTETDPDPGVPPEGNLGHQRNVIESHFYNDDFNQPQIPLTQVIPPFNQEINAGFPDGATDYCEISGLDFSESGGGDPGCIITIEVDLKTMKFITLTRVEKS